MILIVVYDDHKARRDSLELLINNETDMKCQATFANCLSIQQDLADLMPDVVLMDIGMPKKNGIEGVYEIRKYYPSVKILMQTVFDNEENIFESILAGASGYILKNQSPNSIIGAIRDLYTGGSVMTPSVARKVLDMFARIRGVKKRNDFNLSERELEILAWLVRGMSYKMIAEASGISIHTVNSHIKNIYAKLHVHSASEAVIKAIQQKIV